MQLQMTTDYALRILVHLASENQQVVSSTALAEKLVISLKYVLRVGNQLKSHGFVTATAGMKGGYTINQPLGEISVYDVIVAFEGAIQMNRRLKTSYCSGYTAACCMVHRFFQEVQVSLEKTLKSETLATLLERL